MAGAQPQESSAYERISQLEQELTVERQHVKELEEMVAKLKNGVSHADLVSENARLHSELDTMSSTQSRSERLLMEMGRAHSASYHRSAMTLKRNQLRSREIAVLKLEVLRWLNTQLNTNFSEDAFFDELSTGLPIYRLLVKIQPSLQAKLGKLHDKIAAAPDKRSKSDTFLAHDNVSTVLKGCALLGVPPHHLVDTSDLVGPAYNGRAVIGLLLAVARVAVGFGIAPPDIVRMEMELDHVRLPRGGGSGEPAGSSSSSSSSSSGVKGSGSGGGSSSSSSSVGGPGAAEAASATNALLKEEKQVEQLIASACHQLNVPAPVRLAPCLYRFGDASHEHFVRVLHGTALVRNSDQWEELLAFLAQLHGKSQPSIGGGSSGQSAASGGGSSGESSVKTSSSSAGSDGHSSSSADTATDGMESGTEGMAVGTSEQATGPETEEQRREREEIEAKREFFYLTALAVKLTHPLKDDVAIIPTSVLYERAIRDNVQFYHFAEWVRSELVKQYLHMEHDERLSANATHDLRKRRERAMALKDKHKGGSMMEPQQN